MHRVFISYHHEIDQKWKDWLDRFVDEHDIFDNRSVVLGDNPRHLPDETIHEIIKRKHLGKSTVTIVLVGTETKDSKHVDWEIYSSMLASKPYGQSGILIINLPTIDTGVDWLAPNTNERNSIATTVEGLDERTRRKEFSSMFPYMPHRIIDSLTAGVPISVIGWNRLNNKRRASLIESTYKQRSKCTYVLSDRLDFSSR